MKKAFYRLDLQKDDSLLMIQPCASTSCLGAELLGVVGVEGAGGDEAFIIHPHQF